MTMFKPTIFVASVEFYMPGMEIARLISPVHFLGTVDCPLPPTKLAALGTWSHLFLLAVNC